MYHVSEVILCRTSLRARRVTDEFYNDTFNQLIDLPKNHFSIITIAIVTRVFYKSRFKNKNTYIFKLVHIKLCTFDSIKQKTQYIQ